MNKSLQASLSATVETAASVKADTAGYTSAIASLEAAVRDRDLAVSKCRADLTATQHQLSLVKGENVVLSSSVASYEQRLKAADDKAMQLNHVLATVRSVEAGLKANEEDSIKQLQVLWLCCGPL